MIGVRGLSEWKCQIRCVRLTGLGLFYLLFLLREAALCTIILPGHLLASSLTNEIGLIMCTNKKVL